MPGALFICIYMNMFLCAHDGGSLNISSPLEMPHGHVLQNGRGYTPHAFPYFLHHSSRIKQASPCGLFFAFIQNIQFATFRACRGFMKMDRLLFLWKVRTFSSAMPPGARLLAARTFGGLFRIICGFGFAIFFA